MCVSHYYLQRVLIVGHTKGEREEGRGSGYYVLLGKANQFLVHDNNEHSILLKNEEKGRVSFIVTTTPSLVVFPIALFISPNEFYKKPVEIHSFSTSLACLLKSIIDCC